MKMLHVIMGVWVNIEKISSVVERQGVLTIYLDGDDMNGYEVEKRFDGLVRRALDIE